MSKKFKSLQSVELKAKLAQLTKSRDILQSNGMEVLESITNDIAEIEEVLASRIGDVISAEIEKDIADYIANKLSEVQFEKVKLSMEIEKTAEGISTKISAAGTAKPRSASSEGGSGTPREGVSRQAVLWNGEEFPSAAACLAEAIKRGSLPKDWGKGNSAVRVLKSLKKSNALFASLELIDKVDSQEEAEETGKA